MKESITSTRYVACAVENLSLPTVTLGRASAGTERNESAAYAKKADARPPAPSPCCEPLVVRE